MAKFKMHGAFTSQADAKRKAKSVGGYVKRINVRGETRYAVISKQKR